MTQATKTFTCFGGDCTVSVKGDGALGSPEDAVVTIRDSMLEWHAVFSRFKPESELTALNADPAEEVPVSPLMARFVARALELARLTGGLVDPTLLDEIERAGYEADHLRATVALPLALALASERGAGEPRRPAVWEQVEVDLERGVVRRPPGVRFDGGGIVKGMFADDAADRLAGYEAFVVDCEGDMRLGGTGGATQTIPVPSPFNAQVVHRFELEAAALCTATIAKRSWYGDGMRPAHHLLNPATGRPVYSGVVQVTALAPTALEGEARCKAALIAGTEGAGGWLPHGGLIVRNDGSAVLCEPVSGAGHKA